MIDKVVVFLVILFLSVAIGANKIISAADCSDSTYAKANESVCRNELKDIEAQEKELLRQVDSLDKQSKNYASELKKLNLQIEFLKAKIKARSLIIAQLKVSISEKVSRIQTLSEKIDREHASLAHLLRNTNEFDNENIVYLVLSNKSISDFYGNLESYASIKKSIKNSVEQIINVKTETEIQKKELENKKNAETDAKAELENAQKKVAKTETEKKQLLAISEKDKAAFQKLAAGKKAQADKIRSALFSLAGISQKIEFGTALEYANIAKSKTGVDPAFLLAILTQESNLGSNVGKCNVPNTQSWDKIMPGPAEYQTYLNNGKTCKNSKSPCSSRDDQTPFQEIVENFGINPYSVALSCPIKSAGPWGGAMGPAQVIPSTWKGLENNLKNLLGYYGNPWSPKDAFLASAIHLTDLGAVGTGTSAQNRAACSYYGTGGSSCAYSRSVQGLKSKIQADIDLLSN